MNILTSSCAKSRPKIERVTSSCSFVSLNPPIFFIFLLGGSIRVLKNSSYSRPVKSSFPLILLFNKEY